MHVHLDLYFSWSKYIHLSIYGKIKTIYGNKIDVLANMWMHACIRKYDLYLIFSV